MTLPEFPDGAEVDNTTPTPDGNLGWWVVHAALPNIIPACDLRPHVLGARCWCRPWSDGEIVSHNALDEREHYQQQGARLH